TILHNIAEDQSNDSILSIDLEYPAQAIGLALGGIEGEEVTAQIDFQDDRGRLLARFEKEIIEDVNCNNFYWFQGSENVEISKILIDFQGTREELEGLGIRWVEPPVYRLLLPQVVASSSLRTELTLTSDGYYSPSRPVNVQFFNDDGSSLTLQVGDSVANEFDLLATSDQDLSGDFEIVSTDGQLVTGYAVLESDSLFAAAVAYAPEEGPKTSLRAVAPRSVMTMPLRKSVNSSQNTGLAFVNPSGKREADIQIHCISSSSTEPVSARTDLQLAPGQKKALFADELCTDLPDEFVGYARVESTVPVAATAVETHEGSAMAEIPAVSTEKANVNAFP
ncbi:MAG TPA: hypothetical protein VKZ59_14505, partial [Acidobacteriota bacterium]|nr:hypothetical protein [Acidobacteriota bacterium]